MTVSRLVRRVCVLCRRLRKQKEDVVRAKLEVSLACDMTGQAACSCLHAHTRTQQQEHTIGLDTCSMLTTHLALCCCTMLCVVVLQEKAQAQGFANALSTIGKFVLKKKAGDKDQLYST